MAHGDAREEKWRGNKRMERATSKCHMTAEKRLARAVQSLKADVHSSPASSRLNWLPRRFKWTSPFRRKTKSGFCACAITFQTQSTDIIMVYHCGTVSAVDMVQCGPVRTWCVYVDPFVENITKHEVGILRAVLVATQVLWLLRFIDLRFGGTCCLFHQGVRSTGAPRCPFAKYLSGFWRSVLLLSWASVRCWISASIGKQSRTFRQSLLPFVYDVWIPGLDYWFFNINL